LHVCAKELSAKDDYAVMPGLVPGILVLLHSTDLKTWMAGT
jgi:hypothetical protein